MHFWAAKHSYIVKCTKYIGNHTNSAKHRRITKYGMYDQLLKTAHATIRVTGKNATVGTIRTRTVCDAVTMHMIQTMARTSMSRHGYSTLQHLQYIPSMPPSGAASAYTIARDIDTVVIAIRSARNSLMMCRYNDGSNCSSALYTIPAGKQKHLSYTPQLLCRLYWSRNPYVARYNLAARPAMR